MSPVNDNLPPIASLDRRVRAAGALRALGHALVSHDVDDEAMTRLATQIEVLVEETERAPQRRLHTAEMTQALFADAPSEGGVRTHFTDCIVTGPTNPMGMAAHIHRHGDEAVLITTLGPAFEGAPGRAHGGVVAALFDEVMGFVLSIHTTPAYTGRLQVNYRAPVSLGEELELRAQLSERRGRKLSMTAHAHQGGRLVAQATGLFVAVDPDHFASGSA